MAEPPSTEVERIEVDRDSAVTLVFADGVTCRFGLEELRLNCPCASCRGLRDRGERPWPLRNSPAQLEVEHAELVGAWGLGITWNDGHSTGIYPWDALRAWCEDRDDEEA